MSAAYEDFLKHVLPYVPHCLEDQAVSAIRNACIDFCRNTLLIQEDLDPFASQANQGDYDLVVSTGYIVTQILSLRYDDRRLERKSYLELERLYTQDWQTASGTPQVYTKLGQSDVTLVPRPDDSLGSVGGRVALAPTRASTRVQSVLLEEHLDDIVSGALSRLMLTPDQPYTDVKSAGGYNQRFKSACAATRAYVNAGMINAPLRARFQRIW